MMTELDATPLAFEYERIVSDSFEVTGNINWSKLHTDLVRSADWTNEGASKLISLAREYGAFMLRNALALAVAADISDGSLGF